MSSHRGKSAGKGKGKFYNKGQARKGPIKKGDSQQRESTTGSVSSRYKFHPMGDSSRSTPRHTFTTVLEHLADHLEKIIVKHSKDVVSSILSMTPLNLAVEEPDHDEYLSLRPEEHLRLAEQRILDRRFDDDHHRWVKRKDIYEDNTSKVFGTVKDEWCTTAMLNKLAQHPDWAGTRAFLLDETPLNFYGSSRSTCMRRTQACKTRASVSANDKSPSD